MRQRVTNRDHRNNKNDGVDFMREKDYVLGLDIGGTNIRTGAVCRDYSLSGFEMNSSMDLFQTPGGEIQALASHVKSYCSRNPREELPRAISIGFPSTVNKDKTKVLSTPNLPGFNQLAVVELLQKELQIPVYINRDVNLLLMNDIHAHGLEAADIVIGCYIGTGLGNAICVRGEMLTGKNGVAGELGHVPILGSKRVCQCGNVGCVENIASGKYLEELQEAYFPGEAIAGLFQKYGTSPVLQEYVEYLSVPVTMEINILDPDYVILGGGVLQMQDFPMELLIKYIRQHTRKPLPHDNLNIVISKQNQESGVIGAGMYAFEQMRKGESNDSTCIRPYWSYA